jgi:hypothetical protein
VGARTGVAGAKTGVTTGVEGVKAFRDSAAGLVEGGCDEAKKRWREGEKETKATAKEGADTIISAHFRSRCLVRLRALALYIRVTPWRTTSF